jgi:hypothetical protein
MVLVLAIAGSSNAAGSNAHWIPVASSAKRDPDKEIASSEPNCCSEWPALCLSLSAHAGVHEDHRRC